MSKFLNWLSSSKYKNKDNIKRDIARDILEDKDFPDTDDKEKIYSYLEYQFRKHNNLDAFKEFKQLYSYYLRVSKN